VRPPELDAPAELRPPLDVPPVEVRLEPPLVAAVPLAPPAAASDEGAAAVSSLEQADIERRRAMQREEATATDACSVRGSIVVEAITP
jgi:hypothetical protein